VDEIIASRAFRKQFYKEPYVRSKIPCLLTGKIKHTSSKTIYQRVFVLTIIYFTFSKSTFENTSLLISKGILGYFIK